MHRRYDEELIEAAVLARARRGQGLAPSQIARFYFERERLYAILDPDERNTAFFRLHLEWFREWGMERLLTGPVEEFPLLSGALAVLAFRKSRGQSDEGAELYVNGSSDRSAVVALRPEKLERPAELLAFLRHELSHLQDMVDPAFGYEPELTAAGPSPGRRNLARERYRLLWDVAIDGRLAAAGRGPSAARDDRWAEFVAAFGFWTEARRQEVFESLWTSPRPDHRKLAELACDPRGLDHAAGPLPGAACPLCGFPTFAWAQATDLAASTLSVIHGEFPHWTPRQGLCARCHEVYRVQRRAPNVV